MPLLEVLDLSWNSSVGSGALHGLLGKLNQPLRELHLVACQLTAADAPVLGTALTHVFIFIREEDLLLFQGFYFLHFP